MATLPDRHLPTRKGTNAILSSSAWRAQGAGLASNK